MATANRTYEPSLPPNVDPVNPIEFRAFTTWTLQELRAIANMLRNPIIPRLYEAPEKPTGGLLVRADGTSWNPGSGRGLYIYDDVSALWRFIVIC